MALSLLALAAVGAKSVATVAACASTGAYARRIGILTGETRKYLDKLISSIFLPALVFMKVLPNMNAASFVDVWPLAVMICCTVLYGLLTGSLVGRSVPHFRGLIMVAVAFPNAFSVPLTLMLALGDLPVLLSDGQEGGEALQARINFLFLMSYPLGVLARWSIGYPILSGAFSLREWRQKVFNPPVNACLAAGALGLLWNLVPLNARASVEQPLAMVLQPLSTALEYAGRCSVPSILMTLGARIDEAITALLTPPKPALLLEESASSPPSMPLSGYLWVLVLRQLVGPVMGSVLACGVLRGLCGVASPVVLLVGMLQAAGPPMINLAVMSGLSGNAEIEVARLLLLTYSFSIISWTGSIAFFLTLL